jgi:aspartate/methionine/tyrosine aminotransferase
MTQPKSYQIGAEHDPADYIMSSSKAKQVQLKEIIEDPQDLYTGPTSISAMDFSPENLLKERILETQGIKDHTPDDILITKATYEANFLALSESVGKGEEIIISVPNWYQFAAYMDTLNDYSFCCGGLHPNNKIHLLYRKIDYGWKYDIERLKELVTHKTALIVVTSPNNPTGIIDDEKHLRAICEIAEDNDSYLLHDQIYRGLELDKPFSSPQALNIYDKVIGTSSLSKTLGLETYLRLGWLATKDKKLMKRAASLHQWSSSRLGSLETYIATRVLEPKKYYSLVERARRTAIDCWNEVDKFMKKHKDIFDWVKPQAAFLSMPRYNLELNSWEFCTRLTAPPYKTKILPGIDYGYEHHLRLGIGGLESGQVKAGLERLAAFIENIT